MNNKGFTLVELLAISVVLGLILIIAVPSVKNIMEDSRKNAFLGDAQTIYRTANMYSMEISDLGGGIFYSKGNNKLDISSLEYDYCIKLNANGDIVLIAVSNGKYFIEANSNFLDLNVDSVIEGNMNSYVCE